MAEEQVVTGGSLIVNVIRASDTEYLVNSELVLRDGADEPNREGSRVMHTMRMRAGVREVIFSTEYSELRLTVIAGTKAAKVRSIVRQAFSGLGYTPIIEMY